MQGIALLFKVLWSPGEAMFLLSKTPRVLAPFLFLCLFSTVIGGITMTKLDSGELALRAIEQSPQGRNLSDEQKQQIKRSMNSPIVKGFTAVAVVAGPPLVILVVATLYFAVFTMLGREGGFKAFLSITAYAFVPSILRSLVAMLSAFTMPLSSIMPDELGSLSPSVFIDRAAVSPAVFTAVSSIDLVSIWILSLLIIGYGFVTRKSVSKATRAAAVIGLFLVYVLIRVGFAALRG